MDFMFFVLYDPKSHRTLRQDKQGNTEFETQTLEINYDPCLTVMYFQKIINHKQCKCQPNTSLKHNANVKPK